MFWNNTKKLRNISNQIDQELTKIDQLLNKINNKKARTKRTATGRENKGQRLELSFDSSKNQLEDKFNQTAFIYQQQTYEYKFTDVEIDREQEQILLDNYITNEPNHYVKQIRVDRPITLTAQVKSNWIQKYLDHGDCEVCIDDGRESIEIIGVQNGIVSCISKQMCYSKVQMEQIYKYDSLNFNFINHTTAISLNTCLQGRSQLYELDVKSTMRIVMRVQNESCQMRRILIIKQEAVEQGTKYQLAWGCYFQQHLTELISLQPGKYKLITLGITPLNSIELYFQNTDNLQLRVAGEQPLKTRRILMKTFIQTYSDGYQPSSRNIQPQYTRNVYMDIGIVVQSYQNIYRYQAKFQDEQSNKQDICLLFRQLYSAHQLQNRLKPGEKIVKFYSIEQKPAKLYVPKKYVVMGSKVMQTMKVHSVFK